MSRPLGGRSAGRELDGAEAPAAASSFGGAAKVVEGLTEGEGEVDDDCWAVGLLDCVLSR